MRAQLISALFLLILVGCSPTVANRGMLLDAEKVASIKVGTSNRDSVLNTLGTPSVRGSFNDAAWYYIGRKTEQYSFLDPEVAEQQIISVEFDENGLVKKIDTIGKDAITAVQAAPGETITYGNETSWLQDLFGNIGRAGLPVSKQR